MGIFSKIAFQNIDYLTILAFSGIFLVLFVIAEIAYHYFKLNVGYTRKFVHVMTGLIALNFPIYFTQPLDLILLCTMFAVILITSKKLGLLPSINAIDRVSRGSVLYPIIVIICFLFQYYKNDYIYFFLPILVLALADPMAEYFGKRFKYKPFSVFGNSKTVSGSLAFLITAMLTSVICLLFEDSDIGLAMILLSGISIAALTTIGEAISIKGFDNFFIPICAILGLILFNI